MWPDGFKFDDHVRNRVLDLRVTRHRTGEREGAFALCIRDALVQGSFGQSVVNISKTHQRPSKHRKYELVDSCSASWHDSGNIPIWNKRTLQRGVVAPGRAHSKNIPGFLDLVSFAIARQEGVNDLGLVTVARVHSMQAKPRPDWRQAAKVLTAGEPVTTLDAFCFRRREQNWHIIAAFRMARCEDLARGCLAQNPFQRGIPASPEVSCDSEPV